MISVSVNVVLVSSIFQETFPSLFERGGVEGGKDAKPLRRYADI
jgi:hypothetical protein